MKNKRGQVQQGAVIQQPVQPQSVALPKKKSKWRLWLIIILILIAMGIAIYFWLSGGDTNPLIETGTKATGPIVDTGTEAGNQILQPPALPD